jgi:glycosyltransferase involved in cell wall biosynthesis
MPEDVQVVFLGGTEGQQEALRAKYGSQRNISVIGRVGHTEVPEYTVSADILVLPDLATHTYNNLYTSPMKLFEYMASRRPIIASRVSSLMEVLNEQSAELFESGNPEALALGVSEVLGHPDRARERASSAYAKVAEFTWEKRAQAILAHMRACVEGKQRSSKGP